MPVVTVRDAHRSDAIAIGQVSAAAVPHVVETSARVAAEMDDDERLGRRRWVALLGNQVAGTATARQVTERRGERDLFLSVHVRPEWGSQGVGTHLLQAAAGAFPGSSRLLAVADGGPISLSFAVRNGFLPESEQPVARVDPRQVAAVGVPARDLRAVTLDALPDLRMLLETHNLATSEDPGQRRLTMYQLRSEWWDRSRVHPARPARRWCSRGTSTSCRPATPRAGRPGTRSRRSFGTASSTAGEPAT